MKKVALAGNPNSGKTTLFNSLTGSTAHVGNWPGVTVDKREGTYKKLDEPFDVVDLPGIYSLSPYTPEEVVSRDHILEDKPDVVINVIDATNIERNLYLTTQLLEIDIPVVVALNMSDVVRKNGGKIDVNKLSKKLGVPVVEISALKGENLDELMKVAYEAMKNKREGTTIIEEENLLHLVSDIKIAFKGKGVDNPLFHAIKLVELDEIEVKMHPDLVNMVNEFKETFNDEIFGNDFEALIANARYEYISKHYSSSFAEATKKNHEKLTLSDKIDKVLTHRIWALPIFVVIMFFLFHFTFSEDLFFMHSWFGLNITHGGWINFFTGMGYEEGAVLEGVPSIGVFLQNWMGFLSGKLIDLFRSFMPEGKWYTSLVCDGVLTGLDSVLSFVPQVMILFLFMAILEDSGYMARVAFILDRAFRRFGLSGRAFIPMLSGFGCSVPAIMSTRTIEDKKERNLIIRLMTCFSCGAKAPIWALLAAIPAWAGLAIQGDLFVFTIYLGGIASAVVFALLLKIFSRDAYVSPFIMELPSYHLPQGRNVGAYLWEKLKHYLIKAATIIAASMVVIWFLKSFAWDLSKGILLVQDPETGEWYTDIEKSILADLGRGISYFYYPLGWGQGPDGWKYTVATLTGLVAKEDVVATLAQLFHTSEEEAATAITLNASTAYSFALYNLFTIPCFAAIGAAFGEQKRKDFWITMSWWFLMSYAVGAITYAFGLLYGAAIWAGIIVTIAVLVLIVGAGIIVARRHKLAALAE